jgi:hypothetical protein
VVLVILGVIAAAVFILAARFVSGSEELGARSRLLLWMRMVSNNSALSEYQSADRMAKPGDVRLAHFAIAPDSRFRHPVWPAGSPERAIREHSGECA